MGDKTLRQVLLGTIHHAIVTRTDLEGVEALSVDRALLEAAGLADHERVEVCVVGSGARFSSVVVPAGRDTGEVAVQGAAAHAARPGDLVTVSVFGWVRPKALAQHVPRLVRVDDQNRPVQLPPPADEAGPAAELDPFDHANRKAEKRARKLKTRAAG